MASLYPVQNKSRPRRADSVPVKKMKMKPGKPQLTFDGVIAEPLLCGAFLKFLKQIYCEESLIAYKEIEYFQNRFTSLSRLERLQDAKAIFEKYLQPGAEKEVNILDAIRMGCGAIISKEEGLLYESRKNIEEMDQGSGLPATVFDSVFNALRILMANDSFVKFTSDPLFDQSWKLVCKLQSFGVHVAATDDEKFSEEEWSILMTGSEEVTLKPGETLVTEGQFNQYFFRLESGKLQVEKTTSEGQKLLLNVLDQPGTVLCEMSIVNHLPTSASIIAKTEATVRKLKASFITNFFLTSPIGPRLGVRFYQRVGRTLCMMLCEVTNLEPRSVFTTQRKSLSEIIGEQRDKLGRSPSSSPTKPRRKGSPTPVKTATAAVKANDNSFKVDKKTLKGFEHRFPKVQLKEPLLAAFECWFEKSLSRRGTLYITSRALYLYSSVFGQKSRDIIPMIEVSSVDRAGTILTVQASKRHAFRFDVPQMRNKAVNLLDSLISALAPAAANAPAPKKSKKAAEPMRVVKTKDDSARVDLNSDDWDKLVARSKDSKCVFTYNKGDVILRESVECKATLFQICSGSCRVEKDVPNPQQGEPTSVVLATMQEGEVFGEIMFLTGSTPTATVIANDDIVELYVVDSDRLLRKLLVSSPQVVVRFYAHLCSTIAARIVEREADGWTRFHPEDVTDAADSDKLTPSELQKRKRHQSFLRANPRCNAEVKLPGRSSPKELFIEINSDVGAVKILKTEGGSLVKLLDLLEYAVLKTGTSELSIISEADKYVCKFPSKEICCSWVEAIHQAALAVQTKTLAAYTAHLSSFVPESGKKYDGAVKSGTMRVQNMQLSRKRVQDDLWENCFVVLCVETLYFFAKKEDYEALAEPTQKVDILFGVTNDYEMATASQRVFQVVSDTAMMLLACKTPEERTEWLDAVNRCKENLRRSFMDDAKATRSKELAKC